MNGLKLGDIARDKITGYEGIVVTKLTYLYNSTRFGLKSSKLKDDKPIDVEFFDEYGLEFVKASNLTPAPHPIINIELGDVVKDKITEFKGKVVGYGYWINGCIRVGVQSSTMKDGLPVEELWIAMDQLEVISPSTSKGKSEREKTGGPMRNPGYVKNPY